MEAGLFALGGIVLGWVLKYFDERRTREHTSAQRHLEQQDEQRRWERQERAAALSEMLGAVSTLTAAYRTHTVLKGLETFSDDKKLAATEAWVEAIDGLEVAYNRAILLANTRNLMSGLTILRACALRAVDVEIAITEDQPDVSLQIARTGFVVVAQEALGIDHSDFLPEETDLPLSN